LSSCTKTSDYAKNRQDHPSFHRYCIIVYRLLRLQKKSDNLVADALIVDGGDPVTFGCGWLIKIGNELKYDNDLPVNFRQDSLPVKLSYKELGTQYTCLRNPPPQPINNIRIIQIITR
jgi:hypothetical protein